MCHTISLDWVDRVSRCSSARLGKGRPWTVELRGAGPAHSDVRERPADKVRTFAPAIREGV